MMITQLPLQVLDNIMFVPRAVLAMPIGDLADKYGFKLDEGVDDLDFFEGMILSINADVTFTLTHHRGNNSGETTLSLPIEYGNAATIARLFGRIADEMHLDPNVVIWRQDYDDPPRRYA